MIENYGHMSTWKVRMVFLRAPKMKKDQQIAGRIKCMYPVNQERCLRMRYTELCLHCVLSSFFSFLFSPVFLFKFWGGFLLYFIFQVEY